MQSDVAHENEKESPAFQEWEERQERAIEQDFENEDEESIAAKCPVYKPIIAPNCWFCKKKLDTPFSELKYFNDDGFGIVPCCSEKCVRKTRHQLHWSMLIAFKCYDHWWQRLTFRIKMVLCWPEPKWIRDGNP